MKKIILTLALVLTMANASWFTQDSEKKDGTLQATPFAKFESTISKEPMLIEFGSVSCHSCQVMGKILYKLKQKYPKANIYFVDIYKDKQAAKKYGIRMIPTQKYLDKNGKVLDTHMGVIEQEALEKKLKSLGIIR